MSGPGSGGGGGSGGSLGSHGSLSNSPPLLSQSMSQQQQPTSHPPHPQQSSTKQELCDEEEDKDCDSRPRDTQYLTENCVLITYFSGDTASNVDDHFSRALSQPTYTQGADSTAKSNTTQSSWGNPASPATNNKGGYKILLISD